MLCIRCNFDLACYCSSQAGHEEVTYELKEAQFSDSQQLATVEVLHSLRSSHESLAAAFIDARENQKLQLASANYTRLTLPVLKIRNIIRE